MYRNTWTIESHNCEQYMPICTHNMHLIDSQIELMLLCNLIFPTKVNLIVVLTDELRATVYRISWLNYKEICDLFHMDLQLYSAHVPLHNVHVYICTSLATDSLVQVFTLQHALSQLLVVKYCQIVHSYYEVLLRVHES